MNNEMKNKAKWVSDLMAADGVKPEQVTPELAMAYMVTVGKKIEAIQNTYLTRNGARDAIQTAILAGI